MSEKIQEQSIGGVWEEAKSRAHGGGPQPLTQYQERPIDFLVEVLGYRREQLQWSRNPGYQGRTWDGTPDPLVLVAESLAAWKDVGVEAATGTQKSHTTAGLILWFIASWKGARAFTFAPKEDQLRLFIWAEIRKMWPRFQARFPEAELTDLRIRMAVDSDEWGAWGISVGIRAEEEVATKAQGFHAEHLLIVTEETPGIDPSIMEAHENTCTAPHNLRIALGNPNHQRDTLHQFCADPDVVAVRISALDHPNVVTGDASIVPGAVSQKSIERRERRYGKDSPKYLSRVRGISPEDAADALFRHSWIMRSIERRRTALVSVGRGQSLKGRRAKGVDVARSDNGDRGAIADFVEHVVVKLEAFPCPDTVALGKRVVEEIRRDAVDPAHVGIDVGGVGGGTVDTTRHLLRPNEGTVRALNGASKALHALRAPDGGKAEYIGTEMEFGNLRAAMYWQARIDLEHGDLALPDDPELIEELLAVQWDERKGKIYIEEKDDLRARLGRSPDKLDAVVMGNFVRPRSKEEPAKPVIDSRDRSRVQLDYAHGTFVRRRSSFEEVEREIDVCFSEAAKIAWRQLRRMPRR